MEQRTEKTSQEEDIFNKIDFLHSSLLIVLTIKKIYNSSKIMLSCLQLPEGFEHNLRYIFFYWLHDIFFCCNSSNP